MAFMMPVVKNDWDIYKSNRSRRVSECSNPTGCRSRKVSECRSEGPSSAVSTSPDFDYMRATAAGPSPAHRSVPANMSSRQYSRNSDSSSMPLSPMKSSPPNSSTSKDQLSRFHNRLLDRLKRSMRPGKDSASGTVTHSTSNGISTAIEES